MRSGVCWQAARIRDESEEHEDRHCLFAAWLNVLQPSERVSFAKDIPFHERDIAHDPDALADLKKIGYMTTPVVLVDDSVIVGFDADKIDQALES